MVSTKIAEVLEELHTERDRLTEEVKQAEAVVSELRSDLKQIQDAIKALGGKSQRKRQAKGVTTKAVVALAIKALADGPLEPKALQERVSGLLPEGSPKQGLHLRLRDALKGKQFTKTESGAITLSE